jgi:hypothetical protein
MKKNKTQEEIIDIVYKKHGEPEYYSKDMVQEAIDLYHDQFVEKGKRDQYGIIITNGGTHCCHKCHYYLICKVSEEPCKGCIPRNGLNAYYKCP